MKTIFLGVGLLLGFIQVGLSETCVKDQLNALDPFTQRNVCIAPYLDKHVVIVAEKDCLPCKEFLQRVQRDQQEKSGYEVRILWVEADPRSCLELSLRAQQFAKSYCVTRKEVQTKWDVRSTPQAFWIMKGHKNERYRGSVDEKKPLPWRIIKP